MSDLFNLHPCTRGLFDNVSPRSHLYSLEAIGIGTPFVESLTGYIIRLSRAYRISPKVLVVEEILPILDEPSYSATTRVHTRWSENAQNLNGMNFLTAKWVQALAKLTLRNNLHLLTMLTWSNVLHRGGMFRSTRAWCPTCYREWDDSGGSAYDPLLWTFRMVTVCPRHHQPLSLRCPNEACQRFLPFLSRTSLPGCCPYCGTWLGTSSSTQISENQQKYDQLEESYWMANTIGDLLTFSSKFLYPPQRETFSSNVFQHLTKVSKQKLALQMKLSREMIYSWQWGKSTPTLANLLQLCFHLRISPLDLLQDEMANSVSIQRSQEDTEHLFHYEKHDRKMPSNTDEIKEVLTAILMSQEKPMPTLNQIAKGLGFRNPCSLYEHCSELCLAITAKRRADIQSLQGPLELILASDELPPPSMRKVAKSFKCSVQVLMRHFPQLCQEISRKYEKYRRIKHEETIRKLREEVRQAVFKVHSQGRYPSTRQIVPLLSKQHHLLRKEVRNAWEEALLELGIERAKG